MWLMRVERVWERVMRAQALCQSMGLQAGLLWPYLNKKKTSLKCLFIVLAMQLARLNHTLISHFAPDAGMKFCFPAVSLTVQVVKQT